MSMTKLATQGLGVFFMEFLLQPLDDIREFFKTRGSSHINSFVEMDMNERADSVQLPHL